MKFSVVELYFLMISPTIFVAVGLDPEGENVCLKTITYTETVTGVPPTHKEPCKKTCQCKKCKKNKCPNAVTEPQVITRSKTVAGCCEGYVEDPEGVKCLPVCATGCGNGKCVAPQKCTCDSGYFGATCDQICGEGKWGKNCINNCNCFANEECDKFFGCVCKPGWMGDRCVTPCPKGNYGLHCAKKCNCEGTDSCDHITGECITLTKVSNTVTNEKIHVKEVNPIPSGGHHIENHLKVESVKVEENITPIHFPTEKLQTAAKYSLPEGKDQVQPETSDTFPPEVDILKEFVTNITRGEIFPDKNELILSKSNFESLEKSAKDGNFIPNITIFSTASFLLLLLIGRKWLMGKIKKILQLITSEAELSDAEIGSIRNKAFIFGKEYDICMNGVAFLASDDKIRRAPSVQSFKFSKGKVENIYTEI